MILRPTVCTEGAAVCAHHTGFWQGRKDSNPRMLESKSSALTNLATPLYAGSAPDVGGVVRARALAKQLDCDMAIIDKRRPRANVSEVMHVIGDIDGRNCVIMDDMIDTAGTLVKAAEVLKERGAKSVYAYCTHPIFSGPAIERITQGDALDEVVVTNTIPLSQAAQACPKIRQLSVAPLMAETIARIASGESVLSLFADQDKLF